MSLQKKVLTVSFLMFAVATKLTTACPSNCVCGGQTQDSVTCQAGLRMVPFGLSGTVTFLSFSGKPSMHNHIPHIQQSDFQSLTNLYSLVISYSDIRTIDDKAFDGLNDLHDLSLANNALTSLTSEKLRGLPKLRTLDLSGNHNCSFDNTLFAHVKQIEELNLGEINISSLSSDIFSGLAGLKVLLLYSNNLKTIQTNVFRPLTLLESLDITGNSLHDLHKSLKPKFKSLRALHLSNNPWICDCRIFWFYELKTEYLANPFDGGTVVCDGPQELRYKAFVNIPAKAVCASPKILGCDNTYFRTYVNQTLSVNCEFEGNPTPQIKWILPTGKELKNTGTTNERYTILNNGTLAINAVDRQDGGQWTFKVYIGNQSDIIRVSLEIMDPTTTRMPPAATISTLTLPPTTLTATRSTAISSIFTSRAITKLIGKTVSTDSVSASIDSVSAATVSTDRKSIVSIGASFQTHGKYSSLMSVALIALFFLLL